MTDLERMRAHLVKMINIKKEELNVANAVVIYLTDELAYLDYLINEGGNHD